MALPEPAEILRWEWSEDGASFWLRIHRHLEAGGLIAGAFGYDAGFPRARFGLYPPDPWTRPETLAPPVPPGLVVDDKKARLTDAMWAAVRLALEQGDSYQVNLTSRIEIQSRTRGAELFHTIRGSQDPPYAVWISAEEGDILSFSPELFFRKQRDFMETKPMKGTAPRALNPEADRTTASTLASDPKTRCENLMITDLLRNDLGILCRPGSIHVPRLYSLEAHPTVWQMTSTICGRLRPEVGLEGIYGALFPCGSVVGAPKRATAEIIRRLEDSPRGLYCGAIGWADRNTACFNVAIRTLVEKGNRHLMGVGSGLVEGSRQSEEQAEWGAKAAFLKRSDAPPAVFTTLLCRDGALQDLPAHAARLAASAEAFHWTFDPKAFHDMVQGVWSSIPPTGQWRVRVQLAADGSLDIHHQPLQPGPTKPRIGLFPERVHSRDLHLYHKSYPRPFYDHARAWAEARGLWDVLFVNEKQELTEGTIHNVRLRLAGRWVTPHVACGLLPGIERSKWLREGDTSEQVLNIEELLDAEGVELGNSLRSTYPVTLDIPQIRSVLREI